MSASLVGRVAVVTGGAAGIGYGIVRRLVEEGATVAIFDQAGASRAASELGAAAAFTMDVRDAAGWEACLREVVDRFAGLHVLVNNAGVSGQAQTPVGEYPPEEFERVIGINLIGTFLGHRFAIPHMLQCGGGAIINMSSGASVKAGSGFCICPYSASKAAIDSLTRTAACEYASRGVRVNSIRPGMIETPMMARGMEENPQLKRLLQAAHPIGRIGTPAEIAAAVVFLASDEAGFITGAHLSVDGGYLTL